jgi:hypothetical protein
MRVIGFYFDILSRIVLCVLLGLAIGYGLAWAIGHGYFQTWRQLPPPPARATALLTAARDGAYIEAADGQAYRCNEWLDECWIREAAPTNPLDLDFVTHPCVSAAPEFFLFANAPRNAADCLQITISYPDGSGRSAYILDRDGKLWAWSHTASAYSYLILLYMLSALGLIIGLVIGVIWARRSTRQSPPIAKLIQQTTEPSLNIDQILTRATLW